MRGLTVRSDEAATPRTAPAAAADAGHELRSHWFDPMLPRAARLGLVIGLLGAALAASAQGAAPWYQHYRRGLELEGQRKWRAAAQAFEAAARIVPLPARTIETGGHGTIVQYDPYFHIARCLVEMGKPRLALAPLKASAQAGVTPRPELEALWNRVKREEARQRGPGGAGPPKPAPTPIPAPAATPAPTATPAAGRLTVQSDPSDAVVALDGTTAGATPLGPLSLSPGSYLVRATKHGFHPAEERVTVTAGEDSTLLLTLERIPAAPAARPAGHAAAPIATPGRAAVPTPAPAAAAAAPPVARRASPPAAKASPGGPPRKLGAGLLLLAVITAVVAFVLLRRRARRRRAMPAIHTAPAPAATVEDAATMVESGATMGGYRLQSVLGRGGMATTYRAERSSDGQPVAVKVPHDGCLADESFAARFVREGQLGEQLHHPRIVRILGAGAEKGRPFLAMELLGGRTLKQELRENAPLPLRRALEITRDIAEALDYAHAKGVVHRDLKPENVMLLPDGTIKVMDFGIARLADRPGLTTSNIFLGTPAYAAPEMVDPKAVDHRVDLYALGIIVYEMLEGAVPFTADSPYRVLEMHLRQPLPAREALPHPVPTPVWALVQRLCEKDPAARYPSAQALLVELNRLLQDFAGMVEGRDVFE